VKQKKSELNKKIKDSLKSELKRFALKSRGIVYFKRSGDYFITIMMAISGMKQEKIITTGAIKPYLIDDLFWNVFQMPDNCNEPIGLRANGAFKVDGLNIFQKNIEYETIENIGLISKDMLSDCMAMLENKISEFASYEDFLNFSKTADTDGYYDYNLVKMLLLINDKQYQQAGALAEELILKGDKGRFKNNGKYTNEHIVDFCKLAMGQEE
jgi:hypothetical protein